MEVVRLSFLDYGEVTKCQAHYRIRLSIRQSTGEIPGRIKLAIPDPMTLYLTPNEHTNFPVLMMK